MCFKNYLLSSIGTVTEMWRNEIIATFNKYLIYNYLNI